MSTIYKLKIEGVLFKISIFGNSKIIKTCENKLIMKLISVEEFKVENSDLVKQWSEMTKEQLLEEIVNEVNDALNMNKRVQLFMNECTLNMSKTTYDLDVIKDLIKDKKKYDLNEFCFNILDKEYNGDERTYYNIVSDLKVNADEFSY